MSQPAPWEPGGEPQWIIDERRRQEGTRNGLKALGLVQPLMAILMFLPLFVFFGLESLGWISNRRAFAPVLAWWQPLLGLVMLIGGIWVRRRSQRASFFAEVSNSVIRWSIFLLLFGILLVAVMLQEGAA